jgi:glycosyltransferase involved in cell wall biosynthesis
MKVLHVLRQLNTGGIECWLDRLVRAWPVCSRPDFHFALEEKDFGSLAPGLLALGAQIHFCPPPRQSATSATTFSRLLQCHGPFDAVHCHNHYASAFHLAIAACHGVKLRISQSHSDSSNNSIGCTSTRRIYEWTSRALLRSLANVKLAVSKRSAANLFGQDTAGIQVLPCGTNFKPLIEAKPNRDSSRFTLIHVGRLVPEKNHDFLLRLTSELINREPSTRLWLVGDGPLRSHLESLALSLGIQSKVTFCGNQADIAPLLAAADVFVFPSHSEGLGLSALEAQAAGLPTLIAAHLPEELNLLPALTRRLALDLPLNDWVNFILEMRKISHLLPVERQTALLGSPFSIEANLRALTQIYAS